MMKSDPPNGKHLPRRRILKILAATSVAGLATAVSMSAGQSPAKQSPVYRWRGKALGADSTILISHPDSSEAARLSSIAVAEIERLEKIFSLMRADSVLVQLNSEGFIDSPPPEIVSLLSRARLWSEISNGAFDVTVQPLWQLYRDHFNDQFQTNAPSQVHVNRTRRLVDYRKLEVAPERIRLTMPNMAVTLNGIAQGAITERVAGLLRAEGLRNSLIDLGEMRALGSRPDDRPWRIGIKDPYDPRSLIDKLYLNDHALATSSVTGTVFDTSGNHHHMINPHSGRPSHGMVAVSVIAKSATDADALSTALLAAQTPLFRGNLAGMGIEQVLTVDQSGSVSRWWGDGPIHNQNGAKAINPDRRQS